MSSIMVAIWPCQPRFCHPLIPLKGVLTAIDQGAQEHKAPGIILNCSIHFSLFFQGFGKSLARYGTQPKTRLWFGVSDLGWDLLGKDQVKVWV